jgi:GLPGLI family protein
MKKLLCLLVLVSVSLVAAAQEKAKYRITYRLDYLPSQKDTTRKTMNWEINIGDSTALFCNTEARIVNSKIDSLGRINVDIATGLNYMSKLRAMYPQRNHLEMIYNFKTYSRCRVSNAISLDVFRYEDSIPAIRWQLAADGEREIMGMKCHKAEGDVGGRHWTAWYSEDVPFRLGPWLLGGLPGMILAAEDSEGIFRFVAIGTENNPDIAVDFHKDKSIKTTKKKYLKMRKEFDEDKIGYLLRINENKVMKVTDAKGNVIKHSNPQHQNYFEREKPSDEKK